MHLSRALLIPLKPSFVCTPCQAFQALIYKFILFFLTLFQSLSGIIHIEEPTNPPPCRPIKYSVLDLGTTDASPAMMSPYALPHSYAPQINNFAQSSINRKGEGFFKDLTHGELLPQVGYSMRGHAFGLNSSGDLIVTIERNKNDVDWFIWTHKNLRREKRFPITADKNLIGYELDFRSINNNQWAVGNAYQSEIFRPLVWNARWGLKPFGFYVGWDFQGAAWRINDKGTILGYSADSEELPPFVWNECQGLEILRNYRTSFEAESCHEIRGPVHFSDMVITPDNFVYGTLWIDNDYYDNDGKTTYFAYRWEPYKNDFRFLDLNGMRINGVNSRHTLVGEIDGQAVLRQRGEKPIFLKTYLKDSSWNLISATAINDSEDIIGYGTYLGAMHIFMLKKE